MYKGEGAYGGEPQPARWDHVSHGVAITFVRESVWVEGHCQKMSLGRSVLFKLRGRAMGNYPPSFRQITETFQFRRRRVPVLQLS